MGRKLRLLYGYFLHRAGHNHALANRMGAYGLIAANRAQDHAAIARGCRYLIDRQESDGSWTEEEFTGTGFPGYGVGQTIKLDDPAVAKRLQQGAELSRAFMLRYDLYRQFFPLMALSRAARIMPIGV